MAPGVVQRALVAQLAHLPLHVGMAGGGGQGLVQAGHHVVGRAGRRHQAVPDADFMAGHLLRDGGRVRQARDTMRVRHRQPAQLARADVRLRRVDGGRHQRNVAGQQVGQGLARTFVGHVGHARAGHVHEQLHGQVLRRAHAGRAVADLAGMGFRTSQQLVQRAEGRRGAGRQHDGRRGDDAYPALIEVRCPPALPSRPTPISAAPRRSRMPRPGPAWDRRPSA